MKKSISRNPLYSGISTASLVLGLGLPGMSLAQPRAAEPIEEVVVTGSFRDSLANALNQKRNAANVQESIMAEDIGKMPDLNLAESLQRISGATISREGGEGR